MGGIEGKHCSHPFLMSTIKCFWKVSDKREREMLSCAASSERKKSVERTELTSVQTATVLSLRTGTLCHCSKLSKQLCQPSNFPQYLEYDFHCFKIYLVYALLFFPYNFFSTSNTFIYYDNNDIENYIIK